MSVGPAGRVSREPASCGREHSVSKIAQLLSFQFDSKFEFFSLLSPWPPIPSTLRSPLTIGKQISNQMGVSSGPIADDALDDSTLPVTGNARSQAPKASPEGRRIPALLFYRIKRVWWAGGKLKFDGSLAARVRLHELRGTGPSG